METANEGEGGGLARSTPASEQITGGPQARDSENNDSSFKEDTSDTLQQLLTGETGKTGTEASTPPRDKVTTGQGLHGTSPAGDNNLDKVKHAMSLIHVETCERGVEADSLQRHMELEGTSSDESGDWETASEASVAYEETAEQKQNEGLDPNGNMDGDGQKEAEDHLKLQMSSGHLDKTGGEVTGQLAEEIQQGGGRTHIEDPPVTDGHGPAETGESLCNVSKTETLKELNDEEPGTGGPHGGKSGLHVEQSVSQLTGAHEEDESQNEEPVYQGTETILEKPCSGGLYGEQSGLHDEQTVSQYTDQNFSLNEEATNKGFEVQAEKPCTGGPHGGQICLDDEQAVSQLTGALDKDGSQNEEANNKAFKIQVEKPCPGGSHGGQSGPLDEQTVSQLTGPHENSCQNEETISNNTETHIEELGTGEPHGSSLHDKQAVSQLTESYEQDGSQIEEPVNMSIGTQMEELGTGETHHIKSGLHDKQVASHLTEPHEENVETINKDIVTEVEEPCTGGSHGVLQDEQSVSQLTEPHETSSQHEKAVKAIETPCTAGSQKGVLHNEEAVSEYNKEGSQNEEVHNMGIETAVEEPEIGGPQVDKQGLHNEEAFSELTASHQEPGNKNIETPMQEIANKNIELQQNVSASEQAEPQVSESVREMTEPHADKTVPHTGKKKRNRKGKKGKEPPLNVQDREGSVPVSDELVSSETCVLETLGELGSHPVEEGRDKTGGRDGTGYQDEEVDHDPSKSQAAVAVPTFLAETYVEETLVGESGPYVHSNDILTHNEPDANDETGALGVDEVITEGTLNKTADNVIQEIGAPTINMISEETKSMSDSALSSEPEEKCIMNVLQETDQEQGPLGTIASEDDLDCKTEKVNNEEVVGTPSTIVHGSGVGQTTMTKDQIEHTITESVHEELLDGDLKDMDRKETEDVNKEMVCQEISSVHEETEGRETEITSEHISSNYAESVYKETDDDGLEVFTIESEETYIKYMGPAPEDAHTGSRDTHEYETAAIDCKKSLQKTLTMDYSDIFSTMKETLESERIEEENEEVFTNLEGTNIQHQMHIVKESHAMENEPETYGDVKSLNAEETGSQALEGDLGLEGESPHIPSGEIEAKENNLEAKIGFSEQVLEAMSHKTSFGTDVGEDDGISYMDINTDEGASEQVPLDETMNKQTEEVKLDKAQNLNDSETYSIPGTLVKPIPLSPVVFSNEYCQKLDVFSKPNEPGDGESLDDSHYKDVTDSSMEETMHLNLQTETIEPQEQIPGDLQPTRTKESQNRMRFLDLSEVHRELAEDEPDQGLLFERGFIRDNLFTSNESFSQAETDNISAQGLTLITTDDREPFTQPKTDNISAHGATAITKDDGESFTQPEAGNLSAQGATLTIGTEPLLLDTTLLHEGPMGGDKVKVDSSTKIVQRAEDVVGSDSPPLLITRQRSNTDPGLGCDDTQQDDQHEKEEPKTRRRSVTPPLDNFTTSFTATSPQIILDHKPLEKTQTSIVYPEVDYDVIEEKKAEDATPRHTFFPTQIFNPLFYIKEGSGEQGFYQDKTLPRHPKESIGKRPLPSPPQDTEILLRGQQPHTISRTSRSPGSSDATVETSATDPTAAHPVNPVWLPPRPMRDFRPLKPNENPLVRRPTVRHRRSNVGSSVSVMKRQGVMNLPTIPQMGVPTGETSSLEENTRPVGFKGQISSTARQRTLPRQTNIGELEVGEPRNKSPMERLAEAEESSGKTIGSPEAVLRRGKRSQMQQPSAAHSIHRRYSTLINSSGLLYQEYSDVALNQEIQRQKPGNSPAEEKDPGSPRLRRRLLSSQDSYLQRLSISSADSLWQDLPKVRDSVTFMSMSREEQKLQEAKFELIMSEALYLRSLNIAVDHFQRSTELQDVLSNQERQWLFSRLSEVRDASNDFLFDLEEEFENNMYNFQVCDVVISNEPNFRKVYLPYVTNQSYQDQTFQSLRTNNPRFQQVLSKLESDPVCQRLSLKSFLILPFQRITRLRLLLQNILKRSAPGSHEELQATEAHNAIEKLIRDSNEGVRKMKDTEELIHLHQKIQFECKIFPLISASRRLVKHGEVTCLEFNPISFKWKGTTRPVYLHLFSDCLLLSRIREGSRFVVFDHASDFRVERCEIKLHSNQKNIFRVFLRDSAATQAREGYVDGHEMQYIFRTETQSQKLRWIYALSPPKEEIDFLRDGLPQVQCLKSYKARENDELSLEKADILMVTQNSDDGWLCGMRLSDLHSGWFPQSHVQAISRNACLRNLQEEQRLQTARAKLHPMGAK